MAWIKRNLLFVVGLVVAVALIGAGVFYLLQQMDRSTTATADLEGKNQKLDQLVQNEPYPEKKNIDLAKAEQLKLQKFLNEALSRFQTNLVAKDLDSQRYQSLLLGTIAELDRAAEQAGTKLPASDYAFTFGPQKANTQIPVSRLGELAAELADIRAISHVLFRAKVHSLSSLKRTGASTNDYGNPDIITGKKPVTEPITGAILRPYEVQFQCFSGEMGAVLAGFANTPETILVRAVNIQRGTLHTETAAAAPAALPPSMAQGGLRGMDPALAARYGLGRPQVAQPAAAAAAPAVKVGEVVVDEKPIQVSMLLDVIKLAAPGSVPAAEKPARKAAATSESN